MQLFHEILLDGRSFRDTLPLSIRGPARIGETNPRTMKGPNMSATIETPSAPSVSTSAPSNGASAPKAPAEPKFCALDSIRASVDLSKGCLAFVSTALDNARALGFVVGNIDRAKLSTAIGKLLAESRKSTSAVTGKGGKSTTSETFDWAQLAKLGHLTPLQATTLSACGAIAASVDKVRRARNASL